MDEINTGTKKALEGWNKTRIQKGYASKNALKSKPRTRLLNAKVILKIMIRTEQN